MEFFLLWVAFGLSFIAGTVWNSAAYGRGYEDGRQYELGNRLKEWSR